MRRSIARNLGGGLLVAGALVLGAAPARANVVERVVAVVEDYAILLSDVRRRAEPYLARIHRELPDGAQRAAATSQLYKQLIERMVDEELESKAATRSKIAVSASEVDAAIERIAVQNGITVERLVSEAVKTGMPEEEYRREIRRQVLDAKMMNLRLQGRIRVTDEDLHAAYQKYIMEERRKLSFEAAWIPVSAPQGAPASVVKEKRQLLERLTAEARSGVDFAELARRHSEDPHTKMNGGKLGKLEPGHLPPVLDRVLLGLGPGEVSGPVRVGDQLVVAKLLARQESELPTFDEARNELNESVYLDKMNKARRRWLDVLRKRVNVEIRL
jgi:peptidyl-prolyl cis-trans isomerase SurA